MRRYLAMEIGDQAVKGRRRRGPEVANQTFKTYN